MPSNELLYFPFFPVTFFPFADLRYGGMSITQIWRLLVSSNLFHKLG